MSAKRVSAQLVISAAVGGLKLGVATLSPHMIRPRACRLPWVLHVGIRALSVAPSVMPMVKEAIRCPDFPPHSALRTDASD